MLIQVLSDTHDVLDYHLSSKADVIVHCGDFGNSFNPDAIANFAERCKKMRKPYVFTLGNHDYWGASREEVEKFCSTRQYNHLSDRKRSIRIGDVRFVGSTLFTNFRQHGGIPSELFLNTQKQMFETYINDFHFPYGIKKHKSDEFVNTLTYIEWYTKAYNYLMRYKYKKDTVIVTHFPMSTELIHPMYNNHILNPYFINQIDVNGFNLILSGHTHMHRDITVDNCRCIINPYGYPHEHGKNGYIEELLIEFNTEM